jgi:prophage regulatory protein
MAAQVHSALTLLRRKLVEARTGYSRSTIYDHIAAGTFPRGVPIGAKAVAWPEHEVTAIITARIAGKSNDEIRKLVARLHAARKSAS